ncbi:MULTISPECIES: TetR/AcrR family transcriptional regulator [Nocardia]|uniref:TetR/AcrR family transcriptional regulator n=1 Tax=Nocardia TaxID=1817 RepID=UPI0006F32A62|nr:MULTISPECIES: TetR/AcrR family transcriptional regulator [Nocardia]KQY29120.1 TetR family transcriptional regulator [Nocardia sp. Root136]
MPPKPVDRRIRPKQERAKATREHILDTAAELFGQRGIDNTSTNVIAAHARISIGTLYRYFPERSFLVDELLDRLITDVEQDFTQRVFSLTVETSPTSSDDYVAIASEILDVFADALAAKSDLVRALVRSVQFYSSGLPEFEPRLRMLLKLIVIQFVGPGHDHDHDMMSWVLVNTGFAAVLRASADDVADSDRAAAIAMTARMIGTWLYAELRRHE